MPDRLQLRAILLAPVAVLAWELCLALGAALLVILACTDQRDGGVARVW